jgi:ubiquinone/menaquinone biosynthesis C-methylase UbiE
MPIDNTRNEVAHFNRWSRNYDRSWIQRFALPIHQDMLAVAADAVAFPQSILDIGCGTGRLLINAAARWPSAHLVGVDPSVGMVEVARSHTQAATFFLGTANSLPVADSSADIVFSSLSFHHWADQANALREIARVLRPRGCLCIADLTMPDWLAKVIRHVEVKGPAGTGRLFTEAGFTVVLQRRSSTRFVLLTLGIKNSGIA